MNILRIYLSSLWCDITSPCLWALSDEKGVLLQSGVAVMDSMPKGYECIVIIASDRVLNVSAALPEGSSRRLRTVLPFIAEEYTIADPENNHVVPGPSQSKGHRILAVIDKQLMKLIVSAAKDAKLSLRGIFAEASLCPPEATSWSLVWDGNQGFIKISDGCGMALDNGGERIMPIALQLCFEAATQLPKKINFSFKHDVLPEQRVIPQWENFNISILPCADWDWRSTVIPNNALNLMWGEFLPRPKTKEWFTKLRPAIYLLLIACAVEIVGTNIEWLMLAHQKQQISKSMQQTFRATFGESATLINPLLQMQRSLAQARHTAGKKDTGDYLQLLDQSSHSLAALPYGSVINMHYEAGRLDVNIKLANKASFNDLKKNLQSNGLNVRVGEIHDRGNGAEAVLNILSDDML